MRRACLLLIAAAVACGRESPAVRAPAPPPIERPYLPPADGRLTERQVQAYVASLRSGAGAARRGREPGEDADSFDGGRGDDEYLWVRQKVLESEMRLDEEAAARREIEIDRKTARSLQGVVAASTDPPTRESLGRQIADLERRAADRERELRKPAPLADAANDALVARYRRQIAAASAPSRRP
jgi:hypothetical protein